MGWLTSGVHFFFALFCWCWNILGASRITFCREKNPGIVWGTNGGPWQDQGLISQTVRHEGFCVVPLLRLECNKTWSQLETRNLFSQNFFLHFYCSFGIVLPHFSFLLSRTRERSFSRKCLYATACNLTSKGHLPVATYLPWEELKECCLFCPGHQALRTWPSLILNLVVLQRRGDQRTSCMPLYIPPLRSTAIVTTHTWDTLTMSYSSVVSYSDSILKTYIPNGKASLEPIQAMPIFQTTT